LFTNDTVLALALCTAAGSTTARDCPNGTKICPEAIPFVHPPVCRFGASHCDQWLRHWKGGKSAERVTIVYALARYKSRCRKELVTEKPPRVNTTAVHQNGLTN
jgi:hypothetical protein